MVEIMSYLKKQMEGHEVTHEFSGKNHFFKVKTKQGTEHNVIIQASCDCKFMGVTGIANKTICSHILAVFKEILDKENISLTNGHEGMTAIRRRACLNLVRMSNRIVGEVRSSTGESESHINKKKEICARLDQEKKHYVTEAIFKTGGRCDILVLDDFEAIEIINTETNKSIEHKRETYPEGIKIRIERCEQ